MHDRIIDLKDMGILNEFQSVIREILAFLDEVQINL